MSGQTSTAPKVGKNAGNRGKGRRKGVPNKTTALMKDAITAVYADLQKTTGQEHGHFLNWAKETPTEFYKLAAKLIPIQVNGSGDEGEHVVKVILEGVSSK